MTATATPFFPHAPPELWPPGVDPDDPFRLGHRYLTFIDPAGEEVYGIRPLTEDDLMYPQEGDYVVQSNVHEVERSDLRIVVTRHREHDPTIVVFSDLGIVWPGEKDAVSPDLAVCFGLTVPFDLGLYYVERGGVNPTVVAELVSPSTTSVDRGRKKRFYARHGVAYYVMYDRLHPAKPVEGYVLEESVYRELPLDDRGWLWVPPLRLWFGRTDGRLACYNEAGERLRRYSELAESETRALQEVGELRRENSALLREMVEVRQENIALVREVAEVRQENIALVEEVAEVCQEVTEVRREYTTLETRLAALEALLRRPHSE